MSETSPAPLRAATAPEPVAPSVDLRCFALAALATCMTDARSGSSDLPEFRFLREKLQQLPRDVHQWPHHLSAYLASPNTSDLPLLELASQIGITAVELLAVTLASAVETDVTVGRAVARLQAPIGGSRPTLALLAASIRVLFFEAGADPIDALVTGSAAQSGLLTILEEAAPLAERSVAVPVPICLALNGYDAAWAGTLIGLELGQNVSLPPSFHIEASRQAKGLGAGAQRILVLRIASSAEGRTVACEIAARLERRAVFIEADKLTSAQGNKAAAALVGLGPWMLLRKLLPVFCYDLGPGERRLLPKIPHYNGPILVLCSEDGSIEASGETPLSWKLGVPSPQERQQLWQSALQSRGLAEELAFRHRHGSGRIAYLSRLAQHHSLIEGRSQPSLQDVIAASMASEGSGLAGLAQHLPDPIPDKAVVLTPALREELDRLLRRCRNRDQLVSGLGASAVARYKPGVRVLFVGPSGTGKTLAAGWLATQLGMPLYRVDLAAVTSKYIGETEKNLAQLLARAEHDEIILLFDEADSLFGKRTEVREANDRFANAQTNYLLQRIESFEGIAILTSNNRSRFDSAFARRLDMIVEFPPPRPEERRALWLSHLGRCHSLTAPEVNQLSRAELCGGDIRNVVLAASVPAHDEQRSMTYDDVLTALAAEFRKLGRELPSDLMKKG
jgi:ATPase family associated with various cellular activities (AAA)